MSNMNMDDLLKAILGGAAGQGSTSGREQDPLSQLSGGGSAQRPGSAPSGGASLQDLLGAILGGGAASSGATQAPQQSGASMQDLIGAILGGGGQQTAPQQTQSQQNPLGDLIGGILGGGAPQGAAQQQSPLGGILDAILGGGSGGSSGISNAFLAPIANALADRLGLSRAMAQAIVAFAVSKLLPSLLGGAQQASSGAVQQQGGLNLDQLLGTMGKSKSTTARYLRKSGMADELAQYVGVDQDTAVQSLQQVFGMLGQQVSGGQQQGQKDAGLKGLLDNWDSR